KAIADLDRAIRLDPGSPWSYSNRGMVWYEKKAYDKAVADLDRAIRLDPDNPDALNGRARVLATCENPKYRDGPRAVEGARRACELMAWTQRGALAALAAACAEAGDYDAAARWQSKANALFPDGKEKAEGEERLKLYRSKTPSRQTAH